MSPTPQSRSCEKFSRNDVLVFILLAAAWIVSMQLVFRAWTAQQFWIVSAYHQIDLSSEKQYFWSTLNKATYAIPISWVLFSLLSGIEFGRRRRVLWLCGYAVGPFLIVCVYVAFRATLVSVIR